MTDDLETRRRRAAWRAQHRGTKEMDVLLGRYAEQALQTMAEDDLQRFEQFLALPDPDLQKWILEAAASQTEFADLVARVRTFHGLE